MILSVSGQRWAESKMMEKKGNTIFELKTAGTLGAHQTKQTPTQHYEK